MPGWSFPDLLKDWALPWHERHLTIGIIFNFLTQNNLVVFLTNKFLLFRSMSEWYCVFQKPCVMWSQIIQEGKFPPHMLMIVVGWFVQIKTFAIEFLANINRNYFVLQMWCLFYEIIFLLIHHFLILVKNVFNSDRFLFLLTIFKHFNLVGSKIMMATNKQWWIKVCYFLVYLNDRS